MTPHYELDLADYRREVSDLYAKVRDVSLPPEHRWEAFRRGRDQLFGTHPQSALSAAQKETFSGLDYFPYDPAYRFLVEVDSEVQNEILEADIPDEGLFRHRRIGRVHLTALGQGVTLSLFWVLGYGGGLFLPFRDATNQESTYGGGRYLLDTIKHADLGVEAGKLVLDFNFAYNPSCAYNARWTCPLAPVENWLEVPIPVGEKRFIKK
jgi:uncharacterized protein (DUF1684 family)